MLTLYCAPLSRSTRFIWLLEELGVAYELKRVSIRRAKPDAPAGDISTIGERDAANVHPHGKVPALVHDGVTVWESSAIALYLTDTFPDAGLGPVPGADGRAAYLSWLAYYGGVFEPAFIAAVFNFEGPASSIGWVPASEVMEHVNKTLAAGPFLLGEAFSALDVLYGSSFALFVGSPMIPDEAPVADYVARLTARPAFARAMALDQE